MEPTNKTTNILLGVIAIALLFIIVRPAITGLKSSDSELSQSGTELVQESEAPSGTKTNTIANQPNTSAVAPTSVETNTQVVSNNPNNASSSYPAKVYSGTEFEPRIVSAMQQGAKQPADFAGHYVFVLVGCGSGCGSHYLYNKTSKELVAIPQQIMVGALSDSTTPDIPWVGDYSASSNTFQVNKLDESGVKYAQTWKLSAGAFVLQ